MTRILQSLTWEGDLHLLAEVRQLGLTVLTQHTILTAEIPPSRLTATTSHIEYYTTPI